MTQYLRDVMRARFVLVGDNFRFGHRQSGDPAVLAALGERYGFETRRLDPVKWRGLVVSTSEVRKRIEGGDVSLAARLLERPYAISGEVVPRTRHRIEADGSHAELAHRSAGSPAQWRVHHANYRSGERTALEFDHQHRRSPDFRRRLR